MVTAPGVYTAELGLFNPVTNSATIPNGQPNLTDTPDLAIYDGYAGGGMLFVQNVSGTISLIVYAAGWASVTGLVTIATGVSGAWQLSCCGNAADVDITIAYVDGLAVKIRNVSTSTFTPDGAAQTVYSTPTAGFNPSVSGLVRVSNGNIFLTFWQAIGFSAMGSPIPLTCTGTWMHLTTGGTVGVNGQMPTGLLPVCAPFVVAGTCYQHCVLETIIAAGVNATEQGTLYVVQFPTYRVGGVGVALPIASIAVRQVDAGNAYLGVLSASGLDQIQGAGLHCPHPASYPSTNPTQFACAIRTLGESISGSWAADAFFDATSQGYLAQPAEVGDELYLSGGAPFVCDGAATCEVGFFSFPEGSYESSSGTGSWPNSSGVVFYAVTYAYTDAAGLVVRSAPTFVGGVNGINVTNGGNLPQINVPPPFSWRSLANNSLLFVEIYRTTVGGETFFFVGNVAAPPTFGRNLITFVDGQTDASISTNRILYTTGGILDCVNPPAFSCVTTHKTRLWGVDETGETIWFTKAFTTGEAPGFNEATTITVPDGGPITALASLDDKLIIFKLGAIFVVYGDGPADTGQGSDLTSPQVITTDVGAVDWRGVVTIPTGLMFLSPVGIYLLGRDLSVQWIGKGVVDTLATYPQVLSATLVPNANQARFVCSNGSSSVTLCYDYLVQEWTKHVYANQPAPVASATLFGTQFATITTDGNIWLEHLPSDANAYYDADTSGVSHFVPTSIVTPWIRIQGIQGYQRARLCQLLFESLDDCGLLISLAANYNNATVQTAVWSSQALDKLPAPVVSTKPSGYVNKGMAMQLTFIDSAGSNATNGQGARFVNFAIELQKLGDRYRAIPAGGRQ